MLPESLTNLLFLLIAGLIFHSILWARNGRFLWRNRRIILLVVLVAEVWTLATDPIGGHWRAWLMAPEKVVGVWLFGLTPLENFLGNFVVSSTAACAVLVFGYSPRRWI
ncbi:MAG: hypothetical protein R3C14_34235 [Caldilineaceae bacterium]